MNNKSLTNDATPEEIERYRQRLIELGMESPAFMRLIQRKEFRKEFPVTRDMLFGWPIPLDAVFVGDLTKDEEE